MRARPLTIVGSLLRRHPEVEEILGWYGVSLTNGELSISLAELCQAYRLDLEDVLTDLQAVLDDDDEEDEDEEDGGRGYVEQWSRSHDDYGYDEDDEGPWPGDGNDDDRWTN